MENPTPSKKQQLTLELLRSNIPLVKAASEANLKLNSGEKIAKKELQLLLSARNKGKKAQDELLFAALPLIKSIASKEFQRRKNWNSRVSYDDIMQEAMLGFIRGLQSFNIEATNTSPTNYLGQWITVSIRRKVEAMDHDFAIPYEMIERHRRIRAVKARIANILEREPNDEELLSALNATEQDGAIYKWGKVDKDNTATRSKQFTQKHLDEYREAADKTYAITSYDVPNNESEDGSYEVEAKSLFDDERNNYDNVDANDLSLSRLAFFNDIFIEMRIGSRQKDVILRYFGLEPYDSPQLQKEIVQQTGVPPKFVKIVVEAFTMYMPLKGGIFHQKMLQLELDDVEALELSWLLPILGEWPDITSPITPPEVLTQTGLSLKNGPEQN